ncbi:MAG: BrnT family toxin [Candidatus Omnitrophica bacterium]|nr:BrnT family toxin [Candidatus Omnitrophota bacterium]
MRINNIKWDDDTILHIARHGVEAEEVEEVCFGSHPLILKSRQNRYYAFGQTRGGRYMAVIFEYLGQNKAKVVTARAMSEAERKFYKKR